MDTNLGDVSLVKDINPGVSAYSPRYTAPLDPDRPYSPPPTERPDGSYPASLVEFKDKVYFGADDGTNGYELYVSDGTTDGTQLIKDINPGANKYGVGNNSSPYNLIEFKDKIYFSADDENSGKELFVSDRTGSGTQLLVDLSPGENNYGANGSDPGNFVELNDKLYFSANDGKNGNELFVTDGTAKGTQLVKDLSPGARESGTNGSYPTNLVEFNGKIYFNANDGQNGSELFVSDGTAEGTQLVKDLSPGKDALGNINGSYPRDLVEFNDKLYFSADDGKNGSELYVSDGTGSGTQLLVDLNPGSTSYGNIYGSYPSSLVEFNGKLYFSADDGIHGRELFVSDGTAEGTQLVKDLNQEQDSSGNAYGSDPNNLTEFNGKLYFTANDGKSGIELFVTDGTSEGTQIVADINPGLNNYSFPNSSFPSDLTVVGDELFFSADNGATGTELFKLTVNDESGEGVPQVNSSDALKDFLEGNGNGSFIDDDGNNVFVLNAEDKYDTIFDFDLGSDRLGLTDGLQFNDLSFAGNNILAGEEVLATLDGINTEQLTASDFETI